MFVRRVYSSISQVLQDKSFSESLWLLWKELLFKRQTSKVLKNNDISLIFKLKHVHTIIVFFLDSFNGKVECLKISLLDYQETICLFKITICIVGQSLLNFYVRMKWLWHRKSLILFSRRRTNKKWNTFDTKQKPLNYIKSKSNM